MRQGFSSFFSNVSSDGNDQRSTDKKKQQNNQDKIQIKKQASQSQNHKSNGAFVTVKKEQPNNIAFENIQHQDNPIRLSNNSLNPRLNHTPGMTTPSNFAVHSLLGGLGGSNIGNINGNNNAGFGGFNNLNPSQQSQFYASSFGSSFNENPYSLLFNQFQSNIPSMTGHQSSENMIIALFQIIESQAKSLQSLYGKVQKMTQRINQFGQKMKQMKKNNKKNTPIQNQQIKPVLEHLNQNIQNIDSKTLIKILFGSNKVYQHKLELNENLDLPLYRERNFSISLKLIDLQGKVVKNHNKIPLSLAIYSSQNPPKFIQKNTAGQKILKGYIEQSLHFGQCRFQKIQIKQVTSHFRNGWVFIVIIPCMTPLGSANPNNSFIDYLTIEPLVLQKIVVKAKKIKQAKKGKQQKQQSQNHQNDNNFEQNKNQQKGKQKEVNNWKKKNHKDNDEDQDQNSEYIYEDK